MAGNGAARKLNCHNRGVSLQERDHHHAQHMQVGAFFFRSLLHAGRKRPDQTVTEQDAQKCADQRGGDFVSDFFWRAAQSSHRDNDAEYGRDDAESGKGIGHGTERRRGLGRAVITPTTSMNTSGASKGSTAKAGSAVTS